MQDRPQRRAAHAIMPSFSSNRSSTTHAWDACLLPACVLLVALCLETIFSVPYRSFYLATGSVRLSWLAGGAMLLLAGIAYLMRGLAASACERATRWQPRQNWVATWLVFGLLFRIAWAALLHTVPRSDGLTYYSEARLLAEQHRYGGGFFPPGFPLFEAPFMTLLGVHVWVTVLCTLLTFTGTYLAARKLALLLGGPVVAAITCPLVAMWPNDIAYTGVNAKETLLSLLITTSLLLYLLSRTHQGWKATGLLVLAGLLNGCAALTQPAFLLFPSVILVNELLFGGRWYRWIGNTAIFAIAMLLAVAPWSYRNDKTYHRMVLISTNGGSVFYRANNPKANGQYIEQGEEALPKDDFAASEEGYRRAKLWIRQHPADFAKLMVRKQVVYLGDNSDGVYESMKRDQNPSALVYAGCKLICNAFWMAIFIFVLVASSWLFETASWPLLYGLCVLPLLYQWCIDSVFEAGARHHSPYFGLVSILAAMSVHLASTGGGRRRPRVPLHSQHADLDTQRNAGEVIA